MSTTDAVVDESQESEETPLAGVELMVKGDYGEVAFRVDSMGCGNHFQVTLAFAVEWVPSCLEAARIIDEWLSGD